jgi:alkanesulfonate monooxygenase SsuD/methylene tetrahydromethanopterin reductase-like flavin-dependent oxidoreductase (luciferase family)
MKFGIFNYAMWHESASQESVYRGMVEQAVLADELGYTGYWIGEHHFTRHGIVGNSLTMAAYIAARTTRLRLGSAVVILPLHNPVRVAEEMAMVDILSNGRLDVGIGSGYQRLEFNGLGVDIAESRARFAESLDAILTAWTTEPFIFSGQFGSWVDERATVHPRPFQQPVPPIYIAISASPETIDFAAKRGVRLLVGGPTDLLGIAPQVIERWQRAMRANGHDPTGIDIPCAKGIYVAPTDEEAEADVAQIDTLWDLKLLGVIGSPISEGGEIPPGYEHWASRAQDRRKAAHSGTQRLVGSPETVAKRVAELRDSGLTYIFGSFGFPGMPPEKILRAIDLFGREVMPLFAD